MKREIKFRAWDQERKKMIYEFKTSGWGKSTYRLLHEENGLMCANYLDNGDWNEPILMQYTGLLDKNGKEIYEGGILKDSSGYLWIVFWHEDHACFGIRAIGNNAQAEIIDNINTEVIGNIYSNPELLKP